MPPQIHTYHCLCTALLLATPHALTTLPQRAAPGLDRARILPLGVRPDELAGEQPEAAAQGTEMGADAETEPPARGTEARPGYSVLVATVLDRRAVVVRREDGFETRWVRRCGRCRTAVGYGLRAPGEGGEGRAEVAYLFEEGLVETGALKGDAAEAGVEQ
jgi:hypothetical protein